MSTSNTSSGPNVTRNSRTQLPVSAQTESTGGFYHAFEERHRGSRDLIKQRLSVYLPFVEPLKHVYSQCTATDLGCGRGEWLELLQTSGFEAHGVDLDDDMLSVCSKLGLSATRQDAIKHLKSLGDNSRCVVSGFHYAEHISFAHLKIVVDEAFRILKPGGLLILETPNPENVVVGTASFYLDPTHQRPLPPSLLSYLAEYRGFERVKILRLQESTDLADRDRIELMDVFLGVSPDYAIVAQQNAEPEILLRFDPAFDKRFGIKLKDLANRYDAGIERRFVALDQQVGNAEHSAAGIVESLSRFSALQDRLIDAIAQVERSQLRVQEKEQQALMAESRARELEQRAMSAESRAQELEQRALVAESRTQDLEHLTQLRAHAIWLDHLLADARTELDQERSHAGVLNQRVAELQQHISQIHHSKSWIITAPLRKGLDALDRLVAHTKSLHHIPTKLAAVIPRAFYRIARGLYEIPKIRQLVMRALRPFPRLEKFAMKMVRPDPGTPMMASENPKESDVDLLPEAERLTFSQLRQLSREGSSQNSVGRH